MILRAACFCLCLLTATPLWAAEVFRWSHDDDRFGGWSGLWLSPDGSTLKAVSDRGRFAEAQITREGGRIAGVSLSRLGDIAEREGRTAPGGFLQDAEALTITEDGRIFIAFEGHHRVRRWRDFEKTPVMLHPFKFFYHLQVNSGFEALASDADGTLYAIPERSGQWTKPFPVWRYRDGGWDDDLSLPRSEKFLVADAHFGPDGRLYVLEREFVWYAGFRSRLRRFALGPEGFGSEEVLWRSRFGAYDNLEGLAVWRKADGTLRATMISDDNFSPLQATYLVEIDLPDAAE